MANSADPDQLASQKPTDLDLHCLQRQDISGFSRTRVKAPITNAVDDSFIFFFFLFFSEKNINLDISCELSANYFIFQK